MKKIELTCSNCGVSFDKDAKEYKRRIKNGFKDFYCTRSCFSSRPENVERIKAEAKKKAFKVWEEAPYAGDEYSPFKSTLRSVKQRNKECDITIKDLKELWEEQQGKCPFTGWDLTIRKTSNDSSALTPRHASLDRIDNSKGYVRENVRWVSVMFNYAKNKFEDNDVLDFCDAVAPRSTIPNRKSSVSH